MKNEWGKGLREEKWVERGKKKENDGGSRKIENGINAEKERKI